MRYTAKIELPVETSKAGNYVLSEEALNQIVSRIKESCNVVSIEWENGNCIATVEMLSPVEIEPEHNSLELFVQDILNQNSGRN